MKSILAALSLALATFDAMPAESVPAVPDAPQAAGQHQPASAALAQKAPQPRPFVLAPHVEGLQFCDAALTDTSLNTGALATRACLGLGGNAAQSLRNALEQLEPGGSKGQVQLGYTLPISLLSLFRAEGDAWVIDEARLMPLLNLIEEVDRPVVIYLASSHFDSLGPLPDALSKDARNFMRYADGKVPELGYFGYPIRAYTLRTDPDIPVNRYRIQALRVLAERLAGLSEAARARIVGYTLGGELHQMYPDFENGAGQFAHVQVTDYSPESIADFRKWLREKWGNVRRLSSATGFNFESFDDIDAPRGGVSASERVERLQDHYSAYASGYVPIAGWLNDPDKRVERLTLYLNGKPMGDVQTGYNRLDVYRAKDDVQTPNVGYRYDLDVSNLAPGKYLAQVVAVVNGLNYELAQARFTLAARKATHFSERAPQPARKLQELQQPGNWLQRWWYNFLRTIGLMKGTPKYAAVPGVESYMDMPAKDLVVHYNPLAREWDEFRNAQVLAYMQTLFDEAVAAGFPEDAIYSHQLNARVNSSWNAQLFAVDAVWAESQDWKTGMNLYGGAGNNESVLRFLKRDKRPFGVPEFHAQQWKQPDVAIKTLEGLRDAGAAFVSPYYLGLMPAHLRGGQQEHGVNRMELMPGNPKDGSDQLYRAIQTMAAQ